MVAVDKLTKVVHFIQVKKNHKITNIVGIYMKYVVRLHGISKAIVLDNDAKFTSKFWEALFEGFDANVNMITT